MLKKYTNTD